MENTVGHEDQYATILYFRKNYNCSTVTFKIQKMNGWLRLTIAK